MGHQSATSQSPTAPARHLRICSAFIHEHQSGEGFACQLFMPSSSFFGHVGPVLFGGDQSFFYTSIPSAEAINPSWKLGSAGPCGRPTRLVWRRAARTTTLAAALCVPWSATCDARLNESWAAACRAVETADARVAPQPRKNQRIEQSHDCSCLVRRVAEYVDVQAQVWGS